MGTRGVQPSLPRLLPPGAPRDDAVRERPGAASADAAAAQAHLDKHVSVTKNVCFRYTMVSYHALTIDTVLYRMIPY